MRAAVRLASRVHVHATVRLLLYVRGQAAVRLAHYACMRAALRSPPCLRVHAALRWPSCESERVGATGRLPSCSRMRTAVFLPSCSRMRAALFLPSCAHMRAAVRLPSCVHGRADMRLPSCSCARKSDASAVQSPCVRVRAAVRSPTCTRLHAAFKLFHGPASPVRVGKIRHGYSGPERLEVQFVELSDWPPDPQTGYETRYLAPNCIWTGIECPVEQMVSPVGRQWRPGVWTGPLTLLLVRTGPECLPRRCRIASSYLRACQSQC